MKIRIRNLLFLVSLLSALLCTAAEFSYTDIVPEVTSIVFSKDSVALTVEPYFSGGQIGETERTRYFAADRSDFTFQQVSKTEFAAILSTDHFQYHMNPYEQGGYKIVRSGSCQIFENKKSTLIKDIEIHDALFRVEMRCHSSIADVLGFKDEIWIATYRLGDHGSYGSEGVLVASLRGDKQEQIDIGPSAPSGIARDPWSGDVWVATYSRLTVVTEEHSVKMRYWPLHDFDDMQQRPDVFVVASMTPQLTSPFAVLANALGEKSYPMFFGAVQSGATLNDRDVLYNFHMFDDVFSHQPQLPEELNALVDIAEPTIVWRRFVCMLDDKRAEELCNLDLDNWPDSLH